MRTILAPSLLAAVVAFVAALAGCPASQPQFRSITAASSARLLVASEARLAFVDGSELRVIVPPAKDAVAAPSADANVDELRTPATGDVGALALGNRALAAIEDGRVRVHPYDGSPAVDVVADDAPIAIAALDDGFLWVEAHDDGDALRLTLVDSDPFGAVRTKTHALLDAPLPRAEAFGVVVDGADAIVGVGDAIARIDRNTGAGTVAWRAHAGANPKGLVVDHGKVVIAGASGAKGFVHEVGASGDIEAPFPLDLIAPSQAAASGKNLVGIDAHDVAVAATAPSDITGLASMAGDIYVAIGNAVLAFE